MFLNWPRKRHNVTANCQYLNNVNNNTWHSLYKRVLCKAMLVIIGNKPSDHLLNRKWSLVVVNYERYDFANDMLIVSQRCYTGFISLWPGINRFCLIARNCTWFIRLLNHLAVHLSREHELPEMLFALANAIYVVLIS